MFRRFALFPRCLQNKLRLLYSFESSEFAAALEAIPPERSDELLKIKQEYEMMRYIEPLVPEEVRAFSRISWRFLKKYFRWIKVTGYICWNMLMWKVEWIICWGWAESSGRKRLIAKKRWRKDWSLQMLQEKGILLMLWPTSCGEIISSYGWIDRSLKGTAIPECCIHGCWAIPSFAWISAGSLN